MDYTISRFTWSFRDTYYTQKSTKPILALKLSVSATITPGGLPHLLSSNWAFLHLARLWSFDKVCVCLLAKCTDLNFSMQVKRKDI